MCNVNSDSCSYRKGTNDDTTAGNRSLLGNDFVLSRHFTSASAGADTRSRQTKRHVSMKRARVCLFSIRERVILSCKIQDFMRSENPQHLVTSCDFSNAICDFSNKKITKFRFFKSKTANFRYFSNILRWLCQTATRWLVRCVISHVTFTVFSQLRRSSKLFLKSHNETFSFSSGRNLSAWDEFFRALNTSFSAGHALFCTST